jgi:hypothetical protein
LLATPFARLFVTALALGALSAAARTYHVAPHGSDAASGDVAAPLRTIQRGADLAQPGDTVLVAPGLYRERIAPPRGGTAGQPIVFRSAVPHGAIVRGSVEWRPTWRQDGPNLWSAPLDPSLFPDPSHRDGPNPFLIPLSSTPGGRDGRPEHERGYPNSDPNLVYTLGQVFLDGALLRQAPLPPEFSATPGSWRYDAATNRLAVHFATGGPDGRRVEITNQRRLFAPHRRQLGHLTVEGFVFEHCGNQYPTNFWEPQHPEWQHAGAVGTRSGHHWVIRGNVIRLANGLGLDLGNEGNAEVDLELGANGRATGAGHHLVEANEIVDNGAGGTASYSGTHLTIRRNHIARNNALRFTGKKRWESGGLKLHSPHYSVIAHNLVHDNHGKWGIWLDQGAGRDTRVVGNLVFHQGVGLDFEIGNAAPALVANNILVDNDIAIGARESGGLTLTHNLILGSRTTGVSFSIDATRSGSWSAARNAVYQNLFIGAAGNHQELTPPDLPKCEDRRLDFNLYTMAPGDRRLAFAKQPPLDLAAWQAAWKKFNGDRDADAHSRALPGSTYTFDPVALTLELNLAFDPTAVVVPTIDPRLHDDFFGTPVAAPRPPGAIATLKPGLNRLNLGAPLRASAP